MPVAKKTARPPYSCPKWMFAAGLFLYLAAAWFVGRFPQTDETFYKAAGREWAATGRFAAPELEGGSGVLPPLQEVFAVYPPLYPLLFGLLVKLVGFSWRTCVIYDALIHAALAVVTLGMAHRLLGRERSWLACVLALIVLPLGTAARPDELAMIFALLALEALSAGTSALVGGGALVMAGLLLGLAGATSPGVSVLLGFGAVCVPLLSPAGAWRAVCRVAVLLFIALLVTGAVVSLLLAGYPGAFDQFFQQESWRGVGHLHLAAYFLWLPAWPTLALLGVILITAVLDLRTQDLRSWARLWLAPGLGMAAVLVFLPGKHTYLWFWSPWMLVASAAAVRRIARRCTVTAAIAGGLLGAVLGLVLLQPLRLGLVLTLLPADQRPAASLERLRSTLPRQGVVLVDEFWGLLAQEYAVRDAWWSRPDLQKIDAVVLSANGTGAPGTPRHLPEPAASYVSSHFEVVRNDLNPRPIRLLGFPLSRSGYGFGALVLRRRSMPSGGPDPGSVGR